MKITILLLSLLFAYNCTVVLSQVYVGYKRACFDFYYPDMIYENLLAIIDTNTRNSMIEKYEKDGCIFRVYINLDTKTGYSKTIIIKDPCNILSDSQKEAYCNLLYRIQFDVCHDESLLNEQLAKKIYYDNRDSTRIDAGGFNPWWQLKMVRSKKK